MPNTLMFKKSLSKATYILVSISIIILFVFLHAYMVLSLLPAQQGAVSIYLPARSGGEDFLIDTSEFLVISSIAIAAGVALAALVIGMLHRQKERLATVLMLWLVALSAIYLAVFVGNIFDELWGGLWSIAGVAAIAIPALLIEVPLISSMTYQINRKQ